MCIHIDRNVLIIHLCVRMPYMYAGLWYPNTDADDFAFSQNPAEWQKTEALLMAPQTMAQLAAKTAATNAYAAKMNRLLNLGSRVAATKWNNNYRIMMGEGTRAETDAYQANYTKVYKAIRKEDVAAGVITYDNPPPYVAWTPPKGPITTTQEWEDRWS